MIQTCLSTKVLIEMVLRQTTGFVDSLLRLARQMQTYVFGLKIQAQRENDQVAQDQGRNQRYAQRRMTQDTFLRPNGPTL